MVQRIRNEIKRLTTGEADGHRMSQAELDAYRRQLMLFVGSIVAILLVLILAIGAYYQYIHLPRQSVASVNGENISRADYWDYRRYELLNQSNQYQQFAQFMEGDQANQYLQLAFEAEQEFDNVENASIDPMTVDQLINNRILMDALDEFGIEITDQEVEDRLVEFFTGMSVADDTDGPAPDPTAVAWATATAEAQEQEMEAAQATAQAEMEQQAEPEATESEDDTADVDDAAPDDATEGDDAAPDDADNGDDQASVDGDADDPSDDVEVMPTPEPEPTPSEADIRATAEATQQDHQSFLLDRAGLSHDDFVELFIKPDIARMKIQERLGEDIPTRGEHVQAAHILVATQDAANVIYAELTEEDADFGQVAEEQSTDSQTAPNGGDLGWFPRGVMVPEFDEIIFDLDVGEISEPFQTDFGWHIATVTDRDEDRPVDINLLQQLQQRAFDDWMQERRASVEIDSDYLLPDVDDPGTDMFQPPATAPDPPQPEMDMDMQQPQEIPIGDPEADDIFEGEDPFEGIEDDS